MRLGWAVVLAPAALAATVSYDFTIEWVRANPDGAFERPTIGINGQWPIPRIEATVGDTILVTQCPIRPGESFLYNFTITQPGTYWYHSHTESQYPDGLRGPLIIHDPESPFKGQYDDEIIMTISDWYHDQMQTLIPEFMRKGNPTGAEPVPQAALMNETQDLKVAVQPGKTYFLRLANIAAFAGQFFWIEGHNMTIVEVDGAYTKPAQANMIYLSAGQRCSVLITTKKESLANYPIVASMDTDLFDVLPDDLNYNVTGWLVYDEEKALPEPSIVHEFDAYDDMDLVPYDEMARLPEPSKSVELDVIMDNLRDGANYAFFNNITYRAPKVPTLYTALTSGKEATNPQIYGTYTHSFVLEKDEIVQVVVNNRDDGRHPFHLHGHHFQVLHRSEDDVGDFKGSETFSETPMRRDTVVVRGNGNAVLRFKADNPGLIATFVEDPLALQASLKLPKNHVDACKAGDIPTAGNAAGNTDLLDLSGENVPPSRLPDGFTFKGIVAFAFSTFMGIFGIYTIASYGLKKDKKTPERAPLLAEDEQRE
ncbi:hypothetical protein FGRMN_338 [Fusarium graminum]|nr:hypothetical protein FGRMN_338 [Fusarium graminum]